MSSFYRLERSCGLSFILFISTIKGSEHKIKKGIYLYQVWTGNFKSGTHLQKWWRMTVLWPYRTSRYTLTNRLWHISWTSWLNMKWTGRLLAYFHHHQLPAFFLIIQVVDSLDLSQQVSCLNWCLAWITKKKHFWSVSLLSSSGILYHSIFVLLEHTQLLSNHERMAVIELSLSLILTPTDVPTPVYLLMSLLTSFRTCSLSSCVLMF